MRVGDIVRHGSTVGLVVDLIQKKCWRTEVYGNKVNWDSIESELHGVVMRDCGAQIAIPCIDLEVVCSK